MGSLKPWFHLQAVERDRTEEENRGGDMNSEPDYGDLSALTNPTTEAHSSPLFNFKGNISQFTVVCGSATKFHAFGVSYSSFLKERSLGRFLIPVRDRDPRKPLWNSPWTGLLLPF